MRNEIFKIWMHVKKIWIPEIYNILLKICSYPQKIEQVS